MTNRITIALALAAGLAGGLLTRYIAPPPVYAQASVTDEVRARSFTVVDEKGDSIGTLTAESNRLGTFRGVPHLVMKDSNGRTLQVFGGTMMRPLAVQ